MLPTTCQHVPVAAPPVTRHLPGRGGRHFEPGRSLRATRGRSLVGQRSSVDRPVSVEPKIAVEAKEGQALVFDRADGAVLMNPASRPVSERCIGFINRAVRPGPRVRRDSRSVIDAGQKPVGHVEVLRLSPPVRHGVTWTSQSLCDGTPVDVSQAAGPVGWRRSERGWGLPWPTAMGPSLRRVQPGVIRKRAQTRAEHGDEDDDDDGSCGEPAG